MAACSSKNRPNRAEISPVAAEKVWVTIRAVNGTPTLAALAAAETENTHWKAAGVMANPKNKTMRAAALNSIREAENAGAVFLSNESARVGSGGEAV